MSQNTSKRQPSPSVRRLVRRHWAVIAWNSARTSRGWSIRDAAKASGVSASQISRFERGMDCTISTLDRLFAATRLVPIVFYDPPKTTADATSTAPNDGTQRLGSPDGSLATETRKPGSLK